MATAVLMPTFGMTEGEATILRWLKSPGQSVLADETLFEAEMEKATIEVPAPIDGVLLSILVDEGQAIKLTGIVGWLGLPGETLAQPSQPASQQVAQPASPAPIQTASQPAGLPTLEKPPDSWIKASPIARNMARQHGIDLSRLKGTGPGRRIVERNVREALAALSVTEPAVSAIPSELQPLSPVRRVTARRMAESFHTAPHIYLQVEVHAGRLVDLRAQLSPAGMGAAARLSYTALLARAIALTLPAHPLLNAAWEDGQVRVFRETHLGIAVASPQGLMVPVLHRVETLTLAGVNEQIAALASRAREGRLTQSELSGGTFTFTNLGMFGVDQFLPILNPPQSAILAAGAILERPVGEGGQVVLRPTLCLTLAADHRVMDGLEAAVFLRDLREILEAPARLLA